MSPSERTWYRRVRKNSKHQTEKSNSDTFSMNDFLCWFTRSFLMLILRSSWKSTKFGPKNQNSQFKLEFDTKPNSNMQNSVVMFTFSFSDRKYPFWANLVQKVIIIALSWNLLARLIQICRTQWCFSLFSFLIRNMLFAQIWAKKSELSV